MVKNVKNGLVTAALIWNRARVTLFLRQACQCSAKFPFNASHQSSSFLPKEPL